jgi:hypothetical protein
MAVYSHFLGNPVKVQYRLGDIFLTASGTFVADSGRSIFLEQHVEQRGKQNYFRWEIPYPHIHRIESLQAAESKSEPAVPGPLSATPAAASSPSEDPATLPSSLPLSSRRQTA